MIAKITKIKDLDLSYRKNYIVMFILGLVFAFPAAYFIFDATSQKHFLSFSNKRFVYLLVINIILIIFITVSAVNMFKNYTNLNSTIGSLYTFNIVDQQLKEEIKHYKSQIQLFCANNAWNFNMFCIPRLSSEKIDLLENVMFIICDEIDKLNKLKKEIAKKYLKEKKQLENNNKN